MDRRNLLRSIFALGGAATVLVMPKSSQAASLFDELEQMEAKALTQDADLPAEGAEDAQYYRGRRRCWWTRDRWGRRVRVCRRAPPPWRRRRRRCWWTRDRWGRRIRVCR